MESMFGADLLLKGMSRRDFLKLTGAALAAASIPAPDICAANLPTKKQYSRFHANRILLTNCNIVDVKTGKLLPFDSILIENGKIAAIGKDLQVADKNALIFNLNKKYVIPGLIDGHAHMTLTGVGVFKISHIFANLRQMDRNFYNQINSGVTTVRDMGSMANVLHGQINKVNKGSLVGPRVVYCNRFLNVKGSHPSITPKDQGFWAVAGMMFLDNPSIHFENMEQLKKEIGPNLENGASFIKLTLDDKSVLCGKKNLPVYTDEMLAYIFDYADKKGVPVSGHSQYKYGFMRTLDYPINSLEHISADEELTETEARRFASKGTGIIPTMVVGNLMAYPEYERYVPKNLKENEFTLNEIKIRNEYLNGKANDYVEPVLDATNDEYATYYKNNNGDELLAKHLQVPNPVIYYQILNTGRKNILTLKDAGALIGCGTDSGVPYSYHGSIWYEIELMNRIGFSFAVVLKCATVNNAKILKMDDKIGTIEEGKFADMVVLDSNPLEQTNITAYRKPLMTYKDGQLLQCSTTLEPKDNIIII